MTKPLIAIVGRPNVGKSTLFNRIVGRRAAIVEDVPGVTRDRHYSEADWAGKSFILIDTGGFEPEAEDEVRSGMAHQAKLAAKDAQAVILVVDAMEGLSPSDTDVANLIRRYGTKIVVAANKIDSLSRERKTAALSEVYSLGLPLMPISSEHGRGIGDLLDMVLEGVEAPEWEEGVKADNSCRLAIVGRPNVGKSTLVNRLLGQDRMLATELPGTTRDSVDASLRYQEHEFVLTDTAGIRKRKNISENVERFSVARALRSIDGAEVVALMLDAELPAVSQDEKLAHLILDRGRALVLVVNKWDKVAKEGDSGEKLRDLVRERLPEAAHAPVLLTSALEGKRVFKVLEEAARLRGVWEKRIPTPEVNRWLEGAVSRTPPPVHKGRAVKLLFATQVSTKPPLFSITVSNPDGITDSYRRYLENRLRETFGFEGVPIRFSFKSRRKNQ